MRSVVLEIYSEYTHTHTHTHANLFLDRILIIIQFATAEYATCHIMFVVLSIEIKHKPTHTHTHLLVRSLARS